MTESADGDLTVVLVHGGFLGPWIWADVVRELSRDGLRSVCVDLPSCDGTGPELAGPPRAAGPALRGDALPLPRPGRSAAAAPDPARSPVGHLDAPPLVPGGLPGGVQRQSADDLLEVPAGGELAGHD